MEALGWQERLRVAKLTGMCVWAWGDRKLPYAEGQLLAPWNPGMRGRLVWGTLLEATLPWTPWNGERAW